MSVLPTSSSITNPPFHRTYTTFYSFCTVHYIYYIMHYSFWQCFSYRTLFYMAYFFLPGFFFSFDWLIFFSFTGSSFRRVGFCSCREGGATLHYHAGPSHCGSFSLPNTDSRHMGSCSCGAGTLVVLWPEDSSPTRDGTCVPALAGRFWSTVPPERSCLDCSYLCFVQDWFLLCLAATSERSSITSLRSCSVLSQPPACFRHSTY